MKHLMEAKANFRQVIVKNTINEQGNLEIIQEYSKADDFIKIEGNSITFKIQDGTLAESGINGIQASDLIKYSLELIKSLNNEFSSRENALTITKLEEAYNAQQQRTLDRIQRNVEGQYKK